MGMTHRVQIKQLCSAHSTTLTFFAPACTAHVCTCTVSEPIALPRLLGAIRQVCYLIVMLLDYKKFT